MSLNEASIHHYPVTLFVLDLVLLSLDLLGFLLRGEHVSTALDLPIRSGGLDLVSIRGHDSFVPFGVWIFHRLKESAGTSPSASEAEGTSRGDQADQVEPRNLQGALHPSMMAAADQSPN